MRNLHHATALFHSYEAREELSPSHVPERESDCRPDWGPERPGAETRAFAERNALSDVLYEIAWTCVYLVILVGVIGTLIFSIGQ